MSMQKTQVIRGPALAAIESMVQGYARRVKRSLRGARITAPRALLLALLVLCLVVLLASRMRIFGRNEGSAAAATRPAPAATTKTSSALAKPDQEPNPASPSRAALSEIAPPTSRGEKTLERRAADAIATGAFSDALPLYDELARQHPDLRVYREALRILRGQKPAGRTADAR
jgi:hypothetical protein